MSFGRRFRGTFAALLLTTPVAGAQTSEEASTSVLCAFGGNGTITSNTVNLVYRGGVATSIGFTPEKSGGAVFGGTTLLNGKTVDVFGAIDPQGNMTNLGSTAYALAESGVDKALAPTVPAIRDSFLRQKGACP
jgi:hypothetical protein